MNQFCKVFNMTDGEDPNQVLFILSYERDSDEFLIQQVTEIEGARFTMSFGFSDYEAAEKVFKEKVNQEWANEVWSQYKDTFIINGG